MQVLIVSRTRGGNPNDRCIGGIARVDGHFRSVRLMNQRDLEPDLAITRWRKGFWPVSTPFQIGDVWAMDLEPLPDREPPHTEDMIVRASIQRLKQWTEDQVQRWVRHHAPTMEPPILWMGGPDRMFDQKLRGTGRGKGFIARERVPRMSTGFWDPGCDLILDDDEKPTYRLASDDFYERLFPFNRPIRCLPYVGEPEPVITIPSGTLLRVSLARWWKPEDAGEERCYLMLSGWY